jgi:hypothetical protein
MNECIRRWVIASRDSSILVNENCRASNVVGAIAAKNFVTLTNNTINNFIQPINNFTQLINKTKTILKKALPITDKQTRRKIIRLNWLLIKVLEQKNYQKHHPFHTVKKTHVPQFLPQHDLKKHILFPPPLARPVFAVHRCPFRISCKTGFTCLFSRLNVFLKRTLLLFKDQSAVTVRTIGNFRMILSVFHVGKTLISRDNFLFF